MKWPMGRLFSGILNSHSLNAGNCLLAPLSASSKPRRALFRPGMAVAPAAAGEEKQAAGTRVGDLPEACLALAIARTTPRDAIRCAAVSPAFRAAADSDHVWARFLPDDLVISAVTTQAKSTISGSKKDGYLALCDGGALLVDDGSGGGGCVRVWLEKATGARCYALSARRLSLPWDDGELSWRWTPHPLSRFGEMAELVECTELDIYGRLPATAALTPSTPYAAYLVYGTAEAHRGLSFLDQETAVAVGGNVVARHAVCLCPADDADEVRNFMGRGGCSRSGGDGGGGPIRRPRRRGDGWWEVEMGRVMCGGDDEQMGEEEVVASFEVLGWQPKRGLIVEGIEFRPVHDSN